VPVPITRAPAVRRPIRAIPRVASLFPFGKVILTASPRLQASCSSKALINVLGSAVVFRSGTPVTRTAARVEPSCAFADDDRVERQNALPRQGATLSTILGEQLEQPPATASPRRLDRGAVQLEETPATASPRRLDRGAVQLEETPATASPRRLDRGAVQLEETPATASPRRLDHGAVQPEQPPSLESRSRATPGTTRPAWQARGVWAMTT
jgi:hypothetical protein